jgi:hypothetical protein
MFAFVLPSFLSGLSPVVVLGVGVGSGPGGHPHHTDTTPRHVPCRNSNQQGQEKAPPPPPTTAMLM